MKLTKEEKLMFLEHQEWTTMKGYCFKACPADDDLHTFVEEAEVDRVYKKGAQTYWWHDEYEQLYDFDEAWEYCLDDFADEMMESDDNILIKEIKKIIYGDDTE